MLEHLGEIALSALETSLEAGPRWLRWSMEAILAAIVLGLLVWSFWPQG